MAVLYLGESMYFHKGEYKNDKAALKSRNSFAVWKILSFKKKKRILIRRLRKDRLFLVISNFGYVSYVSFQDSPTSSNFNNNLQLYLAI